MSRILINPLNIPYQFQHYNKQASREAADPTLIFFKGRYYLFASMSGGFYYSDDMIHWDWHENRKLTPFRYAPDVRQVGDWLIFSSSDRNPSEIYRTKDPMSDDFEKLSEPFPFWDPNTFQDEDGRVYFYWGCANTTPIWGQEFDPEAMTPIGEKKELIFGNTAAHGWERPNYPGRPKEQGKEGLAMRLYRLFMRLSGSDKKPFIEGAFMNKWNGKYYLQYAAPGTELATYGDGVYVGDSPLGPFTYQAHNPFSSKPGGFITGAGHGSTIEDEYGNLWHASTMRISVNANFERRLGLFPAGLDRDGLLFCNQNLADYPLEIPEGKFDPHSIKPKWMLLSYKKNVAASSYREGHEPVKALDEDIRSCWCARAVPLRTPSVLLPSNRDGMSPISCAGLSSVPMTALTLSERRAASSRMDDRRSTTAATACSASTGAMRSASLSRASSDSLTRSPIAASLMPSLILSSRTAASSRRSALVRAASSSAVGTLSSLTAVSSTTGTSTVLVLLTSVSRASIDGYAFPVITEKYEVSFLP